ncbi:MAG: prepilin-type N-terminal cleavage/methylation domain-containing protein [Sedimentisphaerales bacterium]|nr:prepilin-type N-terminal cleavage/methylation domain-containing protein [Sedimentisphaerales bacterium]MBN2843900.1 prepilin-type N-terminal cleavage/methylation domain-containing protein [Sedimentisphaerales bacterium]
MKTSNKHKAFTLVELLITLAIMAVIFVAVGTAFDAAFKSYDINHQVNKVNTSHRNIVHLLGSSLRTAWNDPAIQTINVTDEGKELSFTDSNGRVMVYRFDPESNCLMVSVDGSDESVVLDNISQNSSTPIFDLEYPPLASGFAAGTVSKVVINFSSSYDGMNKTIATSVIPRNIIYGK